MDTALFFFINKGLQNSVLDLIMPPVTQEAYLFFLLLAIPVFFSERKKGLLVLALCLLSFAISDLSANFLKHTFERPRPCHALESVRLLVRCGRSFSLPSNHAANAFAAAATFSHFYKKAALPVFLIAALIAFSRIYVGVHYPSDVIAGAAWGGVIAGIVILIHNFLTTKLKKKTDSQ